MLKRNVAALAAAVLMVVLVPPAPHVWGKPPDLPIDTRDTCRPDSAAAASAPRPAELPRDAGHRVSSAKPAAHGFDSLGTDLGVALGTACPSCCEDAAKAQSDKARSAARLLQIGRACEQRGDFAMARNCYEEAARVCPDSQYALQANGRIAAIQAMNRPPRPDSGGAEEQSVPPRDVIHESRTDLLRIQESHHMLQLGERYAAAGDLERAFRCFQESHAICPACRYGQQAMERMLRMEANKKRLPTLGGVEEQEPLPPRRAGMTPEEFQRREEAHAFYLLGERCRRGGDPRMAYGFYEESQQASPDSYYGIKARERMQQLERQRRSPDAQADDDEAATPPVSDYRGFERSGSDHR